MTAVIDRQLNLLRLVNSYLRSSFTGRHLFSGMPLSVSTELTNNCNLKCIECANGFGNMKRERGFMDIALFAKIVRELSPYLLNINLYFQGEPMLHPAFFSFIRYSKNIHSVVATNGHFLSSENSERIVKSGLNRLIISLDGLDQATYSAYRKNGDIETVIGGIKRVTDAKKRYGTSLKIEIQFLVNRYNEHQIPEVRKLAKSFNVSLKLKSMQVLTPGNIESWMPVKRKFRRYNLKDNEYVIKNSLPNRCARLWFNPVITWDGNVVPCCFDKDSEHIMGNIATESFRDIWEGPKYRMFRKSILSGRNMIEMCRNCTSGLTGVEY
jgi:radical SAM protein with 4Fe4S-binding SPASM domain